MARSILRRCGDKQMAKTKNSPAKSPSLPAPGATSAAPSRSQLAAAGASVVVNVRSNKAEADAVVAEIEAAGGKAMAALGDVGDADRGRSDAAGGAQALRPHRHPGQQRGAAPRASRSTEMTYAEWREVMDVTLDGLSLRQGLPAGA